MDVTNLARECVYMCGCRNQFWNQKSIMSTSLLAAAAAVEAAEVKFNFTSFSLILLAATEKLISTYTRKLNFHCSTRFSITCSLFPRIPAVLSNRFNFYLINFPRFTTTSQQTSPSTSASSLIGFCHRQQFMYCMFSLPYHLVHLLLTHNLISSHIFLFV